MSFVQNQFDHKNGVLAPYSLPFSVTVHKESTPSSLSSSSSSSASRISPAVLLIIVILPALFFISAILHIIVRLIIKHQSSLTSSQSTTYPDGSNSDTLQRQLQQLFHLHDSGLDQAFIDALPVFMYKEIVGRKEPFDCAVCLCGFSDKDKLRLLPSCSHAFHLNCIDTWLLSNSSCPLCRDTLLNPSFSVENPMFDFDDPIEEDGFSNFGGNGFSSNQKRIEIDEIIVENGSFPVRLGKFKKMNEGAEETGEASSSNLGARRCYSMGSYQYMEGETKLSVAFKHGKNDKEVKHIDESRLIEGDLEGKKITLGSKTDSYSVSKIWLWSKKGEPASSSVIRSDCSSLNAELQWIRRTQDI